MFTAAVTAAATAMTVEDKSDSCSEASGSELESPPPAPAPARPTLSFSVESLLSREPRPARVSITSPASSPAGSPEPGRQLSGGAASPASAAAAAAATAAAAAAAAAAPLRPELLAPYRIHPSIAQQRFWPTGLPLSLHSPKQKSGECEGRRSAGAARRQVGTDTARVGANGTT